MDNGIYLPSPKDEALNFIRDIYGHEGMGVFFFMMADLQLGKVPIRDKRVSKKLWGDVLNRCKQLINQELKAPFSIKTDDGLGRIEVYKGLKAARRII